MRWSRSGMGKRGGARVIYLLRTEQGELVLLIVYAKAEHDNLSLAFLRQLAELLED